MISTRSDADPPGRLSLPSARRVIVLAGCLGMAYTQLTLSPATIEFARAFGAGGWHIGILGALPIGVLFMQLAAAIVVNHLGRRKQLWFWTSLVQRLALLPVAVGPWIFPDAPASLWLWVLIALTAANHSLLHFATPLWLSWMGDYLPHAGLNRYWGLRQRWMQWTAAAALLTAGFVLYRTGLGIQAGFSVLVIAGAVLGVVDILCFIPVEEPPVVRLREPRLRDVLAGPFREPEFRRFIFYSCFWNVAAMIGAPFISLYLLQHVGMDLFRLLLLWACSWVGGALMASRLGMWAERFGQRPLLILSTAFKSINMLALILIPQDPDVAFLVLIPVFMVDAVLNAGIAIANNGFMLKNPPAENRTMFIAAGVAFAGLAGGVTSVAAGVALSMTEDWSYTWQGRPWVNYHLIFAASVVMRLVASALSFSVKEATSLGTRFVVMQLVGATPLRMLRFPVGFYRGHEDLLDGSLADAPAEAARGAKETEAR